MRRAPSSGRGVSGRPAPCLPRWEEEGRSRTGATTGNVPEYQGTAVRAFSSAPQRCPGQAPALHMRLHALLESLAVVRVLGGVDLSSNPLIPSSEFSFLTFFLLIIIFSHLEFHLVIFFIISISLCW